jgi:hypothetical protein
VAKKLKFPKRLEKQYVFQKALWKDPWVISIQEVLDQGLEKYQRAWLAGQAFVMFAETSLTNEVVAKRCCRMADAVMAELKRREKGR